MNLAKPKMDVDQQHTAPTLQEPPRLILWYGSAHPVYDMKTNGYNNSSPPTVDLRSSCRYNRTGAKPPKDI
ncbi:unnamed protein product [Clonostachys rosea f. rosea IK726]|uniref:Uncharacterized protein n=1 Tax=Clonostachys rosea f. rosea IK726 TaxID=1349383 RepID=A0ACA9U5F6_BIOOC|nr:unnamed protein product [Clonostachys rosea f. rosea IK726]